MSYGMMLPAASGAPGTGISFGRWKRHAWVGAGLVARQLDADGVTAHLVDRFGEEQPTQVGLPLSRAVTSKTSS